MVKPDIIVEEVPVKMVTLDKFLENKPYPTLIRMDVEGYEVEIVEGMKKVLNSHRPLKLFIEVHESRGGKREEMVKLLEKYGFRIKIVINNPSSPCFLALKEPVLIKNTFNFLADKLGYCRPGYFDLTIDDLLKHELLSEKKGRWVHVLFERK